VFDEEESVVPACARKPASVESFVTEEEYHHRKGAGEESNPDIPDLITLQILPRKLVHELQLFLQISSQSQERIEPVLPFSPISHFQVSFSRLTTRDVVQCSPNGVMRGIETDDVFGDGEDARRAFGRGGEGAEVG
jgi:hypothetical protein